MNRTNVSAQDIFNTAHQFDGYYSVQVVFNNEEDYLAFLETVASNVVPNVTPDGNGIVRTDLTMADRLGYIGVSYYKPDTQKYKLGVGDIEKKLGVKFVSQDDIKEPGTYKFSIIPEEVDLPDVPIRNAGLSLENTKVFVNDKEITGNVHFVDFKFGEKGIIKSGD